MLQEAGLRSLTATPPTLEELFLRHYGDRIGRSRRAAVTGAGVLLRTFLRRDRWMLALVERSAVTILYWSQAISVEGLYRTQAEFDRAALAMESNAALIAMAGPARALNTVGGQVTWQATAFGAIVRRPDEHVPRRSAHPRRGGERARRAGPRRRPSAAGRR